MDQNPEQIYELVVEINYPISLSEVRNPTSECMLKLVLTFLSGFSIEVKAIQKATFEQEQCLSYPEAYEEIISFINLHEVMQKICKSVFIRDFYLTDVTSPGAKKARRLIFTLINFAFYSMNKMEELLESMDEINSRLDSLNDFTTRKNQVMERRKESVLENSRKTAIREKCLKQREEAKRRADLQDKAIAMLDNETQAAKQGWQKAQLAKGAIKKEVLEINEKITEMQSTVVVESPEQYETQLGNYGQDCTEKEEMVRGTIERLRAKRELQNQFDKVHKFVAQEYEKFAKVREARLQSKTLAETEAKLSKQYTEMQAVMQKLHEELANAVDDDQIDAAKVDEIQAQCQEHVAPLLESHQKCLGKSKDLKNRLEEAQLLVQQLRIEKQQLTKCRGILEEEIATFLKDCQYEYDSGIEMAVVPQRVWRREA